MINFNIKKVFPYAVIFLMSIYIVTCTGGNKNKTVNTITETIEEKVDTVFVEKKVHVEVPKIIGKNVSLEDIKAYIDGTFVSKEKIDLLKDHIDFLEKNIDSLNSQVRVYKDSLEDDNIIIYTSDLVDGELLSKDLKYTLKVPKTITRNITKTITEVKSKRGLYLYSRIGGSKDNFNFGPGLQYIDKKNRIIGYDYDVINNSHNLTVGVKILGK